MAAFAGQLRQNEIFAALFNMIISQEVFADNLGKHQTLVDKARVDGGLYGDTKLYYSTDALASSEWGNDAEAAKLLQLHRPEAPKCQAIVLDIFRQIALTVDDYMSKRAFAEEGTFVSFNSVMMGWIKQTKRVYDGTTYNCFIGTAVADNTDNAAEVVNYEIDINEDGNSAGENIARAMADLFTDMGDYTRKYNDYGQLRSYADEDIQVVWNSKYVNAIKKIDLPSIFHDEDLQNTFVGDVLPEKYFGEVNDAATAGDGATVRSLVEQVIGEGANAHHYFAGELIKVGDTAPAGTSYTEDDKIIAKVLVKLPPYMSAFEVATSFFNPKSLTETHFLTFGHNTLELFKNYPFVTVKVKENE